LKPTEGNIMAILQVREIRSALECLPDINEVLDEKKFKKTSDTLFVCALGFEKRCLNIPRILSKVNSYRCAQSIYFSYSTNQDDSESNYQKLYEFLNCYSDLVLPMECDKNDFHLNFRHTISQLCLTNPNPSIIFDISACSSKIIITVLKILFDFDVRLKIVYTEAEIYHPTPEEINTKKKFNQWIADDKLGLSKGANCFYSPELPGYNRDNLLSAIIVFASFKPERNRNAIAKVDETLLTNPGSRVKWIIGEPLNAKDQYRKQFLIDSNKLTENSEFHTVSTYNYKDTLRKLNEIVNDEKNLKYHMVISPLGSKMQSVAIALHLYQKPDTAIIFSQPIEYNAKGYSNGCYKQHLIDFKNLIDIREILDNIDSWKIKGLFKSDTKILESLKEIETEISNSNLKKEQKQNYLQILQKGISELENNNDICSIVQLKKLIRELNNNKKDETNNDESDIVESLEWCLEFI
jgi:hypothetical protein